MFSPDKWFTNPSTGFYSHTIDQSLRFNDNDTAYLSRTPSSASNRRTFTFSAWIKVNPEATNYPPIFSADQSAPDFVIRLSNTGSLQLVLENGGGGNSLLITNRLFRDTSWYHLVVAIDTTNSTADDRMKIYVNGVQETSFASRTNPSLNFDTKVNNTVLHMIGLQRYGSYWDGYMAEVHFVDGTALTPSSFGETKDGVWIPKNPSVTYGNNGYRLEFKQTGTGGASSSTIGADTSGNDNHFTDSGLAAHDVVPDSPSGKNWATMNPLYHSSLKATLSEGNLKVDPVGFNNSANNYGAVSTFAIPKDKKIYIEVECTDATGNSWYAGFATQSGLESGTSSTQTGGASAVTLYGRAVMKNGTQFQYSSSSGLGGLGGGTAPLQAGDILGMAVDGSNGKVWFHKNGSYFKTIASNNGSTGNVGNPSAETDEVAIIDNVPAEDLFVVIGGNTSASAIFVNFGQDSQNVASPESDANGLGTFEYAPPTDYVCLAASSLSDPTIGPGQATQADQHFDSTLYTGNGGTQSFVNAGSFQPDFVWQKNRSSAANHILLDSVRGGSKYLLSNSTSADLDAPNYMTFNSDGATFSSTDIATNQSGQSYVAWNWKAGGTAVSNSDGSITSQVSANTDAGFSIVGFTSTGNTETVGHGLTQAPTLYIRKSRSNAENWIYAFTVVDGTLDYMFLNTSNAAGNSGAALPTSTVFQIGGGETNGETHVALCFHSVPGYSSVGRYVGNNNLDGTFVALDFSPTWVVIKRSDGTGWWAISDSVRSTFNEVANTLAANESYSESTLTSDLKVDFLSNGFKIRDTDGYYNASGGIYIFLAFAEAPFKFANAR